MSKVFTFFGHACKFGLSQCIKTGASILTILIIARDTGQGGGKRPPFSTLALVESLSVAPEISGVAYSQCNIF